MAVIVPIDDPDDPRIADYVGLSDRDLRRIKAQSKGRQGDFFIAEGSIVVRHLLRSPYPLRSVLVTARGLRALQPDLATVEAPVYLSNDAVIRDVAGFNFHRGALASAARIPLPDLRTVAAGADLLVAAEGVNDHENLGAIFRNAAAFGAGGLVLDPTSGDPLYRRSVRVSMGHVLRLPFTRAPEWPAAIGRLQDLGFEVLALTPASDAEEIRRVQRRPRQVLLVGAEGAGLSAAVLAAADHRVRIRLAPGVDSLNVATAAALALHHLAP